MKKIVLVIFCSLLFLSCKNGNEPQPETSEVFEESEESSILTNDPLTTKIALASGYENFEDVKQMNFTFNVKVNDTLRSSRAWKWFPQEDRVELTEKDETFSYMNDGDFDEAETGLDQKFVNDTYWLLFPFQLVWSDYKMEHNRSAVAPISKDNMQQLSVMFNSEGGYTPGDTYHLFFTDDNMIKEWTYESSEGRNLSTTFEDYETFEGITIAKTHKSEDGSFELFFTDIEVVK
jgi:hypothetical protein